jgi:hypothetical protein
MATSLAYDSYNVAGISKRLIETAELLCLNSDTIITFAEEKVKKKK